MDEKGEAPMNLSLKTNENANENSYIIVLNAPHFNEIAKSAH